MSQESSGANSGGDFVPWAPDDELPALEFVRGFRDDEWKEIWAVFEPHDGFPMSEAAFRREVERSEGAYDAEWRNCVGLNLYRSNKVRELQALINHLHHVVGSIERNYPHFALRLDPTRLLKDLRTMLADAEENCETLRRANPLPRRHSREIDAYWRASLAIWERVLHREVLQSRQLIQFLVTTGRPVAGRTSATPDAARRFIRAELGRRKLSQ